MRFPPIQLPSAEQQQQFLDEGTHGTLTVYDNGKILSGITNYFQIDQKIMLHLGKTDEQVKPLRDRPQCLFTIYKPYSMIPSHWVEKDYGGAANMCFKYQEYHCDVELIEETAAKNKLFNKMMEHFLENGTWSYIQDRPELYEKKIANLVILQLKPYEVRTKWNFLQQKTAEQKSSVLKGLKERGLPIDLETAVEMQSFL